MDSVGDRGPVDVRWSGLARALGLGPLGGLVVDVLGGKGTAKQENIEIMERNDMCESCTQTKQILNRRFQCIPHELEPFERRSESCDNPPKPSS